jgi:hypothetical protein
MRIAQVPTTTIPSQIGPIIAMSHLQSSFGSVARVAPYMKRLAMSEKNFPTGAAREAHVPTVTSASQIGPIAAMSHLQSSFGSVARVALYMKRLATSEKNFATGAARLAHVPTVTSASQIGPIAAISHLRFSLGRFAFVASWVNDIPRVPG